MKHSSLSPLVSIIVPCFDSSSTIVETIDSIKLQSYEKFECIIVDDNSRDASVALIKLAVNADSRFRLITSSSNQGVSSSRNLALDLCRGQFLAFLDSDDLWHSEFLASAVSSLLNGEDFVYASVLRFLDTSARPSFLKVPPTSVTLSSLKLNNHIPLLTAVFRSCLLNSDIRFGQQRPEDYIFWINLFRSNQGLVGRRIGNIPLAYYRVSLNQRSSNKLINIRRAFHVYQAVFHMPLFVCFVYTVLYVLNSLIDYFFQYTSPIKYPFSDSSCISLR